MVFVKGQSGNPGGERKGKQKQIQEQLLPHVPAAIQALISALGDEDKAVAAARDILDRVYGKAPQAVEHTGEDGGPITVHIIESLPDADKS
jgi:hypothetical protein